MRIIPENNTALCERDIADKARVCEKNIEYEKNACPVYKILDITYAPGVTRMFKVGDRVLCSSTGTKLKVDDEYFYLFDIFSIACRILN